MDHSNIKTEKTEKIDDHQFYKLSLNKPGLESFEKINLEWSGFFDSNFFRYGESLFTSLYCQQDQAWFFGDHLERIKTALKYLTTCDQLSRDLKNNLEFQLKEYLVKLKKNKHVYLRVTLFRSSYNEVYLLCSHKAISDPRENKTSLHLVSSDLSRAQSDRKYFKWGDYSSSLYAKQLLAKSEKKNCDEVLFLNQKKILESQFSSIFFFDGSSFYTPRLDENILDGVYRKNLVKRLQDKHQLEIRELNYSELCNFESAFLTNSVKGMRQIESIDDIKFKLNVDYLKEAFY